MVAVPDWEMRRRAAAKPVTATPPVALPTLLPLIYMERPFRHDGCNGNPVGVRGQRGDRKIQGRQKMCHDRGSNSGLRN